MDQLSKLFFLMYSARVIRSLIQKVPCIFHGYQCVVLRYLAFVIWEDPDVLLYMGNFTFEQVFS